MREYIKESVSKLFEKKYRLHNHNVHMVNPFTNDIDFSSVTKKEVSFYIDIQTKLPPNRKVNSKYRDLSIKEVIELNLSEKEVQTQQNINK